MKIDNSKSQIRKFGLILAAILVVMGSLQFYKGKVILAEILIPLGAVSIFSSLFFQPIIRPVYIVMMKAAHVLGWINTRILLGLIFYLLITPIGLVLRLLGKDILGERIEKERESYWEKKKQIEFTQEKYEKQY